MTHPEILIVGAGPTGLVLAIGLARRGVKFHLIDENSGPGEHSRAMAVHARTLEFYDQLGFADEVIAEGIASDTIHLRESRSDGTSREILRVTFDQFGEGLSPYPFVLTYPQDAHERLLVRKLESLGGKIAWNTKLAGFTQDDNRVLASITEPNGTTTDRPFTYICGCDGARSQVRKTLDIDFDGGTYEQPFYVADVKLKGGYDEHLYMNLGENIIALMMPVRGNGMQRLIGLVPPELADNADVTFEDFRDDVERLVDIQVEAVNWFSRYKVHHRVAERFQVGRAFLLGDAGHIHSPVGGQGMNTGIGDAINLAWKLALVADGRAEASLLDTYEPERIAFARSLVATTDSIFAPMIAPGIKGDMIRRVIAPLVGIVASKFSYARKAAFRTVSQIRIHYPESPLSEGSAGEVSGGDRLPWVNYGDSENFASLRGNDWQLHVYGEVRPAMAAAANGLGLPVEAFPWGKQPKAMGLEKDAVYLLRPDGYIGLAASPNDGAALKSYFNRIAVQPNPTAFAREAS